MSSDDSCVSVGRCSGQVVARRTHQVRGHLIPTQCDAPDEGVHYDQTYHRRCDYNARTFAL